VEHPATPAGTHDTARQPSWPGQSRRLTRRLTVARAGTGVREPRGSGPFRWSEVADPAGDIAQEDETQPSGCGVGGQQRGGAVWTVRDGVVAAVGAGVNGDNVGAVGEVAAARHVRPPVVDVEDGQPAA